MGRWMGRVVFLGLVLGASAARAEIFYEVDFEDGTTEASVGTSREELIDGSVESVANPAPDAVNGSALVGRLRVEPSDTNVRAELSSARLPTEGQTYRYRWSYYVSSDFFAGADVNWLLVSQWKTYPCSVCQEGYGDDICGNCGGIFNDLAITNDEWKFRWRAEPDCHTYFDPVLYDRWVRFELLVYWTMESDGYVRLWQDGELVQSLDDIRTLFTSFEPDTCNLYWAVGLYTNWIGDRDYLELFVDDLEISDDTAPPTGSAGGAAGAASTNEIGGSGHGGHSPSGGSNSSGELSYDGGAPVVASVSGEDEDAGGCGCRGSQESGRRGWGGFCLLLGLVAARRFRRGGASSS